MTSINGQTIIANFFIALGLRLTAHRLPANQTAGQFTSYGSSIQSRAYPCTRVKEFSTGRYRKPYYAAMET